MSASPRIAITMGDPAGIGPELCLQLLDRGIIYGDMTHLQRIAKLVNRQVPTPEQVNQIGSLPVVECGMVSPICGQASFQYVETAIQDALAGHIDAIVTLPINKESWHAAGIKYPGHTELLTDRTGNPRTCMMLTSQAITTSLVTTHVGYADVIRLLTTQRIIETIELTAAAMRRLRGHEPRMIVCGLNPHAGEGGLFGQREEERAIIPAVESARRQGFHVQGPLPPDTAFIPSRREATDAYICMYHDQGLIPLKALAFDSAVNVTLNLPFARTSPDHGTAFDIAWRGKANAASAMAAVDMACRLCTGSSTLGNWPKANELIPGP